MVTRYIDITGQKFNQLTVLSGTNKRTSRGSMLWKCICNCGNITYVNRGKLKSGHTKSCGCLQAWATYVEQRANQR